MSITSHIGATFASDDFPHQHYGSPIFPNGTLSLTLSYSSTKEEGYKRVVPKSVFTIPIGELQGGELKFTTCHYLRYVAYHTDEVKRSVGSKLVLPPFEFKTVDSISYFSGRLPASTTSKHYVTCEYMVVKDVPSFTQLDDAHLRTLMEFDSIPFQYQQYDVYTAYRINFAISSALMIGGNRSKDDPTKGTTIRYTAKGIYFTKLILTTEDTFLGIFPAVKYFSAEIDHTFSCSLTAVVTTPIEACGADPRLVETHSMTFDDIPVRVVGTISSLNLKITDLPVMDVHDQDIIDYAVECPDMMSRQEVNSIVPVLASFRSNKIALGAFKMPLMARNNKASFVGLAGVLGSVLIATIFSLIL